MTVEKVNYDENYDMLFIHVSDNSLSYGAEEINNITIFRNVDTDNITGFMITGFMDKFNNGVLPELPYGYKIDYLDDVVLQIK